MCFYLLTAYLKGWVEYRTEDDLERAIKEMDGAKYRGDYTVRVTKVTRFVPSVKKKSD